MFKYLFCAIVINIIVCLVYKFLINDKSKRKKSENLLTQSAGIFDDSAKDALNELVKIDSPTPGDYFRRGNIIQYNILENNLNTDTINNRDALKNVFRDYTDTVNTMRG